jgi:hypothetical protein
MDVYEFLRRFPTAEEADRVVKPYIDTIVRTDPSGHIDIVEVRREYRDDWEAFKKEFYTKKVG